MFKTLIINSGGTFNKIYDHVSGELIVPDNNSAVEKIFELLNINFLNIEIVGIVYKDSLQMIEKDRIEIGDLIESKNYKKIIIVHGTDTINLTAEYLSNRFKNSHQIVLIGAMKPISINPIDGAVNFGIALSLLQTSEQNDIYIAMSGLISHWNKISKNKKIGRFEVIN